MEPLQLHCVNSRPYCTIQGWYKVAYKLKVKTDRYKVNKRWKYTYGYITKYKMKKGWITNWIYRTETRWSGNWVLV